MMDEMNRSRVIEASELTIAGSAYAGYEVLNQNGTTADMEESATRARARAVEACAALGVPEDRIEIFPRFVPVDKDVMDGPLALSVGWKVRLTRDEWDKLEEEEACTTTSTGADTGTESTSATT